jgi:hypothetical protein
VSAKTLARKVLTLPLMVLAACLILFEDFVWNRITVLVGIISGWQVMARIERWVLARGRYATLALFAVPITALVPIKLIAVYLIVSGQVTMGIAVIVVAKLIGTAISARLFVIAKPQLMTFETFVLVHDRVLRFKAWAHQVVAELGVREALARLRASLRAARQGRPAQKSWGAALIDRLLAARRLLRRSD